MPVSSWKWCNAHVYQVSSPCVLLLVSLNMKSAYKREGIVTGRFIFWRCPTNKMVHRNKPPLEKTLTLTLHKPLEGRIRSKYLRSKKQKSNSSTSSYNKPDSGFFASERARDGGSAQVATPCRVSEKWVFHPSSAAASCRQERQHA